jgi:alkylhydroperoxidase family enzyme
MSKPISTLRDSEQIPAVAWAEAVTRLTGGDVSDDVYAETRRHFPDKEVADLSFAVAEINAWNRLMICTRTPPQFGGASA